MNNGRNKILEALATTGDSWVKLATLFLVAISGLFNFIATEKSGVDSRQQLEREIHEVHSALDRNKEEFRQIVQDAAETRRIVEDMQRKAKQ